MTTESEILRDSFAAWADPQDIDPEYVEAMARAVMQMPNRTPHDVASRYAAWVAALQQAHDLSTSMSL